MTYTVTLTITFDTDTEMTDEEVAETALDFIGSASDADLREGLEVTST
jgi:hypothetical protein